MRFNLLAHSVMVSALLLSACGSSNTDDGTSRSTTPVSIGSVNFTPATSDQVRFATAQTPMTTLRGRHYDSNGDGLIDSSDDDNSRKTRSFSYAPVTISGIPAVQVSVQDRQDGVALGTPWSFVIARSTNGPVYVIRYVDGGPADFTSPEGGDPVLFLPYNAAGLLTPGTTYAGGFNHAFTPLNTWEIGPVNAVTPLGLSNATEFRTEVGTTSERRYWFSPSNGVIEMDDGYSLAPVGPG